MKACLLILLCAAGMAQAPRRHLTPAQAQQLESVLSNNPGDRGARASLLDHYFVGAHMPPAAVITSRRRHILWLIDNRPDDPLAGSPQATIDAAGHRLADAEGFQLASTAWKKQTAKPDTGAQALANAAYFFKLADSGLSMSLLERAVSLAPANKEFAARLGDQYALAIMGITMVNKNGYPMAADPSLAQGPAGVKAREALKRSSNPYVLAKAGYMLSFQGTILRAMRRLPFDATPLAEETLQRAVSLVPGDQQVAAYAAQHRMIQQQVRAGRAR